MPGSVPVSFGLGSSGIVLGGGAGLTDAAGVLWKWTSDSAMGEGADTREETGDNANRDGLWDATRFVGGQLPLITGSAHAPSLDALFDAERRIRAQITVVPDIYTLTIPGFVGAIKARRTGRVQWTPLSVQPAYAQFSFTLFCKDPYITSAAAQVFTLGFPALGGLDRSDPGADRSDPGADRASTDAASTAILVNDGPVGVPLTVTVGPGVTKVVLTLQQGSTTQVQTLTNTDGAGLPLTSTGQTLVVDNKTGAAKLNGTGRNSWVGGDLLQVPPGTSAIYLTGVGTGSVSVSFASVRP